MTNSVVLLFAGLGLWYRVPRTRVLVYSVQVLHLARWLTHTGEERPHTSGETAQRIDRGLATGTWGGQSAGTRLNINWSRS